MPCILHWIAPSHRGVQFLGHMRLKAVKLMGLGYLNAAKVPPELLRQPRSRRKRLPEVSFRSQRRRIARPNVE